MNATTKLAVKPYKNRGGSMSWRLTGLYIGVRIRKNFRDRADAQAEKKTLEIKALQITSGMRVVATFLTNEQLREAQALFARIHGQPHSLSFYVEYALKNLEDSNGSL